MACKKICVTWVLLGLAGVAGCSDAPDAAQGTADETQSTPAEGDRPSSDQQALQARTCTSADIDLIRSGTAVTCSATLPANSPPIDLLLFDSAGGSDVTFDCNGATVTQITVRSWLNTDHIDAEGRIYAKKLANGYYHRSRPENVTIKNCTVTYRIDVEGIEAFMWTSSRDPAAPGHVARARDAAPRNITFDHLTTNKLYVHVGPTYITLKNSTIKGAEGAGAIGGADIYLDAESAYNTIRNNIIKNPTTARELIAIDGSSYNKIFNNTFESLENGGIFLYRNCGELGAVRYSTPSNNEIINNFFKYTITGTGAAPEPAVWIGSRRGTSSFCNLDSDVSVGGSSGTTGDPDWDHAKYNAVMQNRIYRHQLSSTIRIGADPSKVDAATLQKSVTINNPNYVGTTGSSAENTTVTVTTPPTRAAGCYIGELYGKNFLVSGESISVSKAPAACFSLKCNDGVVTDGGCDLIAADGFLDEASETVIRGWARDRDINGPILVHIYIDGVLQTGIWANEYRPDLQANLGYSWVPPKLKPGPHRVDVYAIGVDTRGALTGNNPLLAQAPRTIYAKDFVKPGNNGTVSCDTFCEGAQWGEVGFCVGAVRSSPEQRLTCSSVPGLITPAQLLCECKRPVNGDPSFEGQAGPGVGAPWFGAGVAGIDRNLGFQRSAAANAWVRNVSGWNEIRQVLPALKPSTSYRLTGWIQSASTNTDGYFGIRNVGGGAILKEIKYGSLPIYTKYTIDFTTGTAVNFELFGGLWGNSTNPWARFDDIMLEER